MKHVRALRLIPLAALGLLVLLAGCMDFSKFSNDPVEVAVVVTDEAGNPISDGTVILVGPETYTAWVSADGVAQFPSVIRGNYVMAVDSPSGYSATTNIPVWGGKSSSLSIKADRVENLMVNPSFDEFDDSGDPIGWSSQIFTGSADFSIGIGAGPLGGNAAVVHTPGGVDGAWQQDVAVEKNTTYRLSGWIRAENFNRGTGFGAQFSEHHIGQSSMTNPRISGDGWHYVSSTFNSGDREKFTILTLVGGWGESSGTFYFTGVSLVKQ